MDEFLESNLRSGTIIAHNAAFEVGVMWTHFPSLRAPLTKALKENRIYCTKVYEELLNCIREKQVHRKSLADLVMHYFDKDIFAGKKEPDAWRLRYSELDGVPLSDWPPEAVEYAISDSEWAYRIYHCQEKGLVYGESVRAEALLNIMGKYGILVDKDRVHTLEEEIYVKLEPSYQYLIKQGLAERLLNSRKVTKKMALLREYLNENVPKEQLKYTAKGCVSTSAEDMASYPEDPVISAFNNIAQYEKVITAFVSNLKQADPVIRTRYSATKSTGRTSSSKDATMPSVNIQQMPREVPDVTWDVRNCFIPRAGYKICSIDYSGLELASAAHQLGTVYGTSKMKDKVNYGNTPTDMHSMLAYQIRNMEGKFAPVTYEEFVKNKKKETYKEYRQLAKPINLGFPGGIGYDTMRSLLYKEGIKTKYKVIETADKEWKLKNHLYILKKEFPNLRIARTGFREYSLVVDELVQLKNALFESYPELGHFLREGNTQFTTGHTKRMKNEWGEWEDEEMYAYNIYGMKRDWATYTAFCNGFLMQTPAAIGAKRMMSHIIEKYANDTRMNPLAFIHDEIVFEVVDTDEKYGIIRDVSKIMIDEMQSVLSSVRIAVEAEVMDYWMKAGGEWSKTYWIEPNSEALNND